MGIKNNVFQILNSRSIKINYLLNFTRVLSGALIGIFTMPYINKALGAEVLGKVEYVNTLINYFVLFSALGIPMYGIREVSKVRDKPIDLAKLTIELFCILIVTTLISYCILFGVIYNLNYFVNYRDLILVMSSMVFLTNIGAEWFFQGLENQLYITVRYVVVRVISLFIILFYINNPNDYLLYGLCLVITACGANIFNIYFLYRSTLKVNFDWKSLNIKRHFRPILLIFLGTISVNIYLQLDNFLIGSLVGAKYVGYYAVANKLIRFVIGFITIIGAIMLPRLSLLYNTDFSSYLVYLKKSLTMLLFLSIPFSVYFFVFSDAIISIFGGVSFGSSILTMKILSPLCIIVSIAYFMGFLVLYPMGKEKIYTWAVLTSAIFSIVCNFYAIKHYQHNGAAVIAILSELFAIIFMYFFIRRERLFVGFFTKSSLLYIVAGVIMLIVSEFLQKYITTNIWNIGIFSCVGFLSYFVTLLIFREDIILGSIKTLKRRIKNMY